MDVVADSAPSELIEEENGIKVLAIEVNEDSIRLEAHEHVEHQLAMLEAMCAEDTQTDANGLTQRMYDGMFKGLGGSGSATAVALAAHIAEQDEEIEASKKRQRVSMKRFNDSIEAFANKQDPSIPLQSPGPDH
eukprot:TRINITY_DN11603_c0_g1_i1.p2 TRINITY_DN11603_c0_g1~~TRINITY_DN11603_c0_g1_i1.p2  ORF type:complete len:134 (+),score=36.17 TRINITY_DN11603_c0_g1_i1:141-542(+)